MVQKKSFFISNYYISNQFYQPTFNFIFPLFTKSPLFFCNHEIYLISQSEK